jgi:hypothetical protein
VREEDDNMEGVVQEGEGLGRMDETVIAEGQRKGSANLTFDEAELDDASSSKPFGVYADPQSPNQASGAGIESANKPGLKSVRVDTAEMPDQHNQLDDHVSKNLGSTNDMGIAEKPKQGVKRKAEASKSKSKSIKVDVENEKPSSEGLRRSGRTKRAGA